MDEKDVDPGQEPSEVRRRSLIVLLVILVMVGFRTARTVSDERPLAIDWLSLGLLVTMTLVVALMSTNNVLGDRLGRPHDDELTHANRASAAGWGFWTLFTALAVAMVANFLRPIDLIETVSTIMIVGAAAAGFRFAFLERRGV